MRTTTAAVLLASALALGCRSEPFRPTTQPVDIRLDLELGSPDGSPTNPIHLVATVRNVGKMMVYHITGCGCPAIGFGLLGPDGAPVCYFNPCLAGPMCPCGEQALQPETSLQSLFHFAGDVYVAPPSASIGGECTPVEALPGEYTVVVRFCYSVDGEQRVLERRATFHWSGQPLAP